jgi:hypothetical protein
VAGRWAVIVAVETYRHPEWAGVPYAESAGAKLAKALETAGISSDRQIHLFGPDATKGTVEARLRNLRKRIRKGDTLLVFISARTFMHREETYFALWDALPDLPAESGVSFAELLKPIRKADVEPVTLFFDPAGEWNDANFDGLPGIASCSPGETSAAAATLRSSLWAHLVVEALSGDAAVTLDSIRAHVVAGLPRLLRRHAAPGTVQTPLRFGSNRDVPIREAMPQAAKPPVLDPARLARVVFRSETRLKVKELAGFRKPHKIPVAATPAARAFVARLAADDVQRDLDRTAEAVRDQFGYKRKEIDRGPTVLRMPDFEYAVTVDLDGDDSAVAVIRRDVSRLRDAAFVRSTPFATFGKRFDSLVFEFAEPINVAAFADCLEDLPGSVATVTLSADGRSAEATVPGVPGRIVVERNALIVRGRGKDTGGLVDLLLAFLAAVGPVGDPSRALTPLPQREQ